MIKLVKNELIKIFKRKSIYFMFFLSIIAIVIYNNMNLDQQILVYKEKAENIGYISDETIEREKTKGEIEQYIYSLQYNEYAKLYNTTFKENSWQRYALNNDSRGWAYENFYDNDITKYLTNIKDYEYNENTKVTKELYETSKNKYNEYVNALKSNDWKSFVNLKIKNLEELKNTQNLTPDDIKEINFEIDWYYLRLNHNINFGNEIINEYLTNYREKYYLIIYEEANMDKTSQSRIRELNENKSKLELLKYVIENDINYDISNEKNFIANNKIDARISFIRTFDHFNLILIIIAIYISSTIITDELTKKTIKNILTKPHKRYTIIISKVIACIVTIIISMIFISIIQFFAGGFKFGFDSYANGYLGYDFNNNKVFNMSLLNYLILSGITKIPEYIIISLFCIFIGIFNKNIAMSMILTLMSCLFANTALAQWSKVDTLSKVARFFITNNWDFSTYLFGNISGINGINLWHSILIYLIYFAILLKLITSKFKKLET